jgi:hypothetical protein
MSAAGLSGSISDAYGLRFAGKLIADFLATRSPWAFSIPRA